MGDEAGGVSAFDNQKREVVYQLRTARRSVSRIIPHPKGIIVSYCKWLSPSLSSPFSSGDGTVALYRRDFAVDHPTLEFSGSDIDPIYDMGLHENTLYTASRDNCIRKYTIPDL